MKKERRELADQHLSAEGNMQIKPHFSQTLRKRKQGGGRGREGGGRRGRGGGGGGGRRGGEGGKEREGGGRRLREALPMCAQERRNEVKEEGKEE